MFQSAIIECDIVVPYVICIVCQRNAFMVTSVVWSVCGCVYVGDVYVSMVSDIIM